jgi:hypothetical protein
MAVLAGYAGQNNSHIFIIARDLNNEMILIDPQLHYLDSYEKAKDLIQEENRNYVLLFQSSVKLTNEQIRFLGFIF